MHEVENLAQVAPEPVESVHHDRVATPCVREHLGQTGTLDGGASLFVAVGLLDRDAGSGEGVELAFEALLSRGCRLWLYCGTSPGPVIAAIALHWWAGGGRVGGGWAAAGAGGPDVTGEAAGIGEGAPEQELDLGGRAAQVVGGPPGHGVVDGGIEPQQHALALGHRGCVMGVTGRRCRC